MEGTEMTYNIIPHGFEVGKDITFGEWMFYSGLFYQMYSGYIKCISDNLKAVDQVWKSFEDIKKSGNMFAITMAASTMGVRSDTTHDDYRKSFMHRVADKVNKLYDEKLKDLMKIEGYVNENGNEVMYCGRFKEHPEWTMEFALKIG